MYPTIFIITYIALVLTTIISASFALLYKNRSEKDVNTNCHNFHWFNTNIVKWMKASKRTWRPFGLLMLDVDNFKAVNDIRGHAMGDRVLREIVQILQDSVRLKNDYFCFVNYIPRRFKLVKDFVIRRSGDEFLFVLRDISLDDLEVIAGRISRSINEKFMHDENKEEFFHMSASIGGTIFKPMCNDVNVSSLMDKVDKAMYDSKSAGKNCVTIRS